MKSELTITTCDITGEEGAKPVTFGFDKVHYAIDLCDACHAKLTAIYAPYIEKGTRVKANSAKGRHIKKAPEPVEETPAKRIRRKPNLVKE